VKLERMKRNGNKNGVGRKNFRLPQLPAVGCAQLGGQFGSVSVFDLVQYALYRSAFFKVKGTAYQVKRVPSPEKFLGRIIRDKMKSGAGQFRKAGGANLRISRRQGLHAGCADFRKYQVKQIFPHNYSKTVNR
jgi:hypothetical protein